MSLLNALKVIIDFLVSEKIPYMVIGGIANSFYGEPRQTYDIDIKIKITDLISLETLIDKLSKISSFIQPNPTEFAKEMRVLPVKIDDTIIDLIFADLKYEQDAIENSIKNKFDSIELNVCTPEDLVIQKCISEREKDWNDIKNIIRINRNKLNTDYLIKHCRELSIWLSNPDLLMKIEGYLNGE